MQRIANPSTAVRFRSEPHLIGRKALREPCIVGVSDAKIDDRGCVSKLSSVLSIQRECATEALKISGN